MTSVVPYIPNSMRMGWKDFQFTIAQRLPEQVQLIAYLLHIRERVSVNLKAPGEWANQGILHERMARSIRHMKALSERSENSRLAKE